MCPDGPVVLAAREGADGTWSTVWLGCIVDTAASAGRLQGWVSFPLPVGYDEYQVNFHL